MGIPKGPRSKFGQLPARAASMGTFQARVAFKVPMAGKGQSLWQARTQRGITTSSDSTIGTQGMSFNQCGSFIRSFHSQVNSEIWSPIKARNATRQWLRRQSPQWLKGNTSAITKQYFAQPAWQAIHSSASSLPECGQATLVAQQQCLPTSFGQFDSLPKQSSSASCTPWFRSFGQRSCSSPTFFFQGLKDRLT